MMEITEASQHTYSHETPRQNVQKKKYLLAKIRGLCLNRPEAIYHISQLQRLPAPL